MNQISFQQKSHYAKFQLNLMRNGCVTTAVLHGFLQCCKVTDVLSLNLILSTQRVIIPKFSSINQKLPSQWLFKDKRFYRAALNTAVLQVSSFVSRIDPFHLRVIMQNFSSIRREMTEIQAVQCLEILQRCMEYCSAAGSLFCIQTRLFTP